MMRKQDNLSPEEHEHVLREGIFPEYRLDDKTSLERPRAIILAGQPGAGKGGLAGAAKDELYGDAVTVDPDALRDYPDAHPDVERFRQKHPYAWADCIHNDAPKGDCFEVMLPRTNNRYPEVSKGSLS